MANRKKALTPAEQLKRRVVQIATEGLAVYYEKYPNRLDDPRGKDAHDYSMTGVGMILAEVDKYRICERGTKSESAKIRRGVYAQVLAVIQGRTEDYLAAAIEALTPAQQSQAVRQGLKAGKQILALLDAYEIRPSEGQEPSP